MISFLSAIKFEPIIKDKYKKKEIKKILKTLFKKIFQKKYYLQKIF